jgi:hypothetical protein
MRTNQFRRARAMAVAAALAALSALPARAADPWGLANEKPLSFRAKVVDLLCPLTGDCPADCGAGKRQMGLLTEEGVLRAAVKGNVEFAGPVADLVPYCGRTIEVDGLLIDDPRIPLYFVQAIRTDPSQPWQPTEAFRSQWSAAHGDPQDWMRKDPQVKAIIAKDGVFGIPGLRSKSPDVSNPDLKASP